MNSFLQVFSPLQELNSSLFLSSFFPLQQPETSAYFGIKKSVEFSRLTHFSRSASKQSGWFHLLKKPCWNWVLFALSRKVISRERLHFQTAFKHEKRSGLTEKFRTWKVLNKIFEKVQRRKWKFFMCVLFTLEIFREIDEGRSKRTSEFGPCILGIVNLSSDFLMVFQAIRSFREKNLFEILDNVYSWPLWPFLSLHCPFLPTKKGHGHRNVIQLAKKRRLSRKIQKKPSLRENLSGNFLQKEIKTFHSCKFGGENRLMQL